MAAVSEGRRREQRRQHQAAPAALRRKGKVVVVDGFGVSVRIDRGRLLVCDGSGRQHRERRFSKAKHGIARLVVLSGTGSVSLAALRWCSDLGIPVLVVDRDGRILSLSGSGTPDARLRRAQAFALTNPAGLEIARYLLGEKLRGQEALLGRLTQDGGTLAAFAEAADRLQRGSAMNELLFAERDAALAYWFAWHDVPVRFRASDAARVPEHWLRFGSRGSPLAPAPRSAVTPANAILNYLYALLEAETTTACLTVGLDPSLGLVHADYRGRDSLALDLMEAVRPQVDAYVLELLERRTFRASDFFETRQGVCRLLPPFSHELAATLPGWAKLVAPVAERVAAMLTGAPGARIDRVPTPLTNANRHAGREAMRRRPRPALPAKPPKPPATCRACGGELPHPKRVYCNDCLPEYEREQFEQRFSGSGMRKLAALAAEGQDPTHGGQAAKRRGQTIAQRKQAIREWEQQFGKVVDLTVFEREILPLIREVPLRRLVEATRLSLRYCSQIRRGEKVPHPRHWQALREASGAVGPSGCEPN
jgi:CRISPR-associated endonuclease Cas1